MWEEYKSHSNLFTKAFDNGVNIVDIEGNFTEESGLKHLGSILSDKQFEIVEVTNSAFDGVVRNRETVIEVYDRYFRIKYSDIDGDEIEVSAIVEVYPREISHVIYEEKNNEYKI